METQQLRSILVDCDLPSFSRRVGDIVRAGEILGHYQQKDVHIPFDGVIEGIFCDGQKRVAHVTLLDLRATALANLLVG